MQEIKENQTKSINFICGLQKFLFPRLSLGSFSISWISQILYLYETLTHAVEFWCLSWYRNSLLRGECISIINGQCCTFEVFWVNYKICAEIFNMYRIDNEFNFLLWLILLILFIYIRLKIKCQIKHIWHLWNEIGGNCPSGKKGMPCDSLN